MVKKSAKKSKKRINKKESIDKNEEKEEINNNKSEILIESKDIDLQKFSKAINKELSQNIISYSSLLIPNKFIWNISILKEEKIKNK